MTFMQARARITNCSTCRREVESRTTVHGRCHACHEYKRRTGRERTDPRPTRADRFSALTQPEPNSGCLLWLGAMASSGYGKVGSAGRTPSAHRVAYELAYGPVPAGLVVRHRCDTKLCVNPAHLIAGTQVENMADMAARGRRPVTSRLSASDLDAIKALRSAGATLDEIGGAVGITASYACVIVNGKQVPRVAA